MQEKEIISISGETLPEALANLHSPPKKLELLGDQHLLGKYVRRVGIVGARKFTPYGREVATWIAAELAKAGVVIVSGLAIGIDGIAHTETLKHNGKTIAVLPSGIKKIYPASHTSLAQNIVDRGGLLISEYGATHRPMKYSFIERNRLIAALSDILIIPEAAEKSGSLHTANFALELGKPIYAVPGNITSPYSAGTNKLIRVGAEPLLDPVDILQALGIEQTDALHYLPENQTEKTIFEALENGCFTTDEIVKFSGLTVVDIQTSLTMLEIKGILTITSGKWSVA